MLHLFRTSTKSNAIKIIDEIGREAKAYAADLFSTGKQPHCACCSELVLSGWQVGKVLTCDKCVTEHEGAPFTCYIMHKFSGNFWSRDECTRIGTGWVPNPALATLLHTKDEATVLLEQIVVNVPVTARSLVIIPSTEAKQHEEDE